MFNMVKSVLEMVLLERPTVRLVIGDDIFQLSRCQFSSVPSIYQLVKFETIEECQKEHNRYNRAQVLRQYRYDFQTLAEWHSYIEGMNARIAYSCIFNDDTHNCSTPEFANLDPKNHSLVILGILPTDGCEISLMTITRLKTYRHRKISFVSLPGDFLRNITEIAEHISAEIREGPKSTEMEIYSMGSKHPKFSRPSDWPETTTDAVELLQELKIDEIKFFITKPLVGNSSRIQARKIQGRGQTKEVVTELTIKHYRFVSEL